MKRRLQLTCHGKVWLDSPIECEAEAGCNERISDRRPVLETTCPPERGGGEGGGLKPLLNVKLG